MAGNFIFTEDILKDFQDSKENLQPSNDHPVSLSSNSLGRIIKDVWGEKVKKERKVRQKGSRVASCGYLNLGRSCYSSSSTESNFNFFECQLLHILPDGWTVSMHDDSVFFCNKTGKLEDRWTACGDGGLRQETRIYKLYIHSFPWLLR